MKLTDRVFALPDAPEPSAKIAKVCDLNNPYTLSKIFYLINLFSLLF